MKKKTLSNLFNIVIVLFVLLLIFVPSVKATILSGLMKVGLFSPSIESKVISKTPENLTLQFVNQKGEQIHFKDLKGKVVFLNFWATWCPPCRAEMPSIKELSQRIDNKDIVFMFVDSDGNLLESDKWLNDKDYPFNNYAIDFNQLPKDWFGGSLPTTLVFNKENNLVFQYTGTANYNTEEFYEFLVNLAQ